MVLIYLFSYLLSAVFIGLICFKIYIKVTTGIYHGRERLDGKTVVITGASAGIGAETAKELNGRGARVIMLCRDMVKGEEVRQEIMKTSGNGNISLKHIDFGSLTSVRKCAKELLSEEEKIDILVNNAGEYWLPTEKVSEDGLNMLMQANHFGPFLLTNMLLGKIKKSAPSKIVNVASRMHHYANLDLDDLEQKNVKEKKVHYSNTKLANIYFTSVLAEKLKGTGVTANSLHPGIITTSITRNFPMFTKQINDVKIILFFKSAWEGAQTTIFLCVSPSVADVTGKYFSDCHETNPSETARDMTRAYKLWDLSEKAVKLQDNKKHYENIFETVKISETSRGF